MAMTATALHADAWLRRRGLWGQLRAIFRDSQPTEVELGQVSTLAEVAIDQVFQARDLGEGQQAALYGTVKDYAECAALYGYVLGYWQARQEIAAGQRVV